MCYSPFILWPLCSPRISASIIFRHARVETLESRALSLDKTNQDLLNSNNIGSEPRSPKLKGRSSQICMVVLRRRAEFVIEAKVGNKIVRGKKCLTKNILC